MSPAPPPPPPLSKYCEKNDSLVKKTSESSKIIPNTSALLKSIEKGTKLKKTVTMDRSAPLISNQTNVSAPNKSSETIGGRDNSEIKVGSNLGGLFANGFPTLKSIQKRDNITKNSHQIDTEIVENSKKTYTFVAKNPTVEIKSIIPEKNMNSVQPKIQLVKSEIAKSTIESSISRGLNNIDINLSDQSNEVERWVFPPNVEKSLPAPRKFSDTKKIYLSQTTLSNLHKSKTSGAQVSEDDINGFIKSLKSKLNKAAADENFEECVRLKSKMKSFEVVKKRIQLKEKVFASDLPK